jgi:alkylation response protein AidB-like acyl-CoA dehydrogenase
MGALIFNQMMIPERLTSAAGALGVRGSLEVAARYSDKRTAFGQKIRKNQAISFMIANGITKLDAARALVYLAARAVDAEAPNMRRLVSEAKKFATDAAWEVANIAMQVMGGIGYTDVYPIEKAVRDIRLTQIWTGTNEIMNLLVQHEYYGEVLADHSDRRNIEDDAMHANDYEKVYVDEDQEKGMRR